MLVHDITHYLSSQKQKIEQVLPLYIDHLQAPSILKDAMNYSLEAGGKRIRPLLLLSTLKAFNKEEEMGLPVACAIEMIHTYSLIHDDLPSMDNDNLRRGKPTNHIIFGEANAILAGDGLLTYSFQLIADMNEELVPPSTKLKLITELAKAAGAEGMVGGQVADIEGEGQALTLPELEYIHKHKTGKLLAYSIMAGGIMANASAEKLEMLESFALHLGLAFQIRDDILDIEGSEEAIGKPVGSDATNHKNTYPSLLTMSGAKAKLEYHIDQAMTTIKEIGIESEILEYLCQLVGSRQN
ncbi:polyprenyl synthetase family protein [Litchfieldia salsa]|uniref:Farnesyl diphosphate synthase n=1 Tax=Litchfieldia salsa TaxID=930152 RepID=A0A1H0WIK4_9BACI|nr:farnesyl diphosphate synthase [Litchfieldia salsa]SDP90467.1 geranylgeranyl diphosphate synthase, type II [Litchfieldia salsa]